jgi:hypothetical protein
MPENHQLRPMRQYRFDPAVEVTGGDNETLYIERGTYIGPGKKRVPLFEIHLPGIEQTALCYIGDCSSAIEIVDETI